MVNTPKKTWQVFLKDICQPMTMDFVPMMNCLGYPILGWNGSSITSGVHLEWKDQTKKISGWEKMRLRIR